MMNIPKDHTESKTRAEQSAAGVFRVRKSMTVGRRLTDDQLMRLTGDGEEDVLAELLDAGETLTITDDSGTVKRGFDVAKDVTPKAKP